jgi:hypothetical protein
MKGEVSKGKWRMWFFYFAYIFMVLGIEPPASGKGYGLFWNT